MSYTFDTLAELREAHGPGVELNWLVGADMLADLTSWHRAAEVVELARIITAARPPWSDRIAEILVKLGGHFPAEVVSRLAGGVVATPLIDISSTAIRRRAHAGQSIRFLTPDAVMDYINRQGIYRPAGL
ncbi:hypothetical protein LCGC14_2869910 [marine sediment metagenome]|uniref:Uncharacterized protein n=1 Tax=marine sediment metagenome TaxID=412755 RepID=A0A0F8Y3G1_9ZZZZ